MAEEELTIHLLVDNTASMEWGDPNKLLYARRAAGAFGYIALSSLDRYDAGGYLVSFGPESRHGSHYVELAVISKNGKFRF